MGECRADGGYVEQEQVRCKACRVGLAEGLKSGIGVEVRD